MAAATIARAIPVFPEVGSTSTVSPGVMSPRFWASLIIEKPMRSFTELQGSMLSTEVCKMRACGVLFLGSVVHVPRATTRSCHTMCRRLVLMHEWAHRRTGLITSIMWCGPYAIGKCMHTGKCQRGERTAGVTAQRQFGG